MSHMNKDLPLVEVATAHVTALRLTGLDNLDPITVYLDNPEPGRGQITIRCWDTSWTAGWRGLSGRSVEKFFVAQNDHYLAKNLGSIPEEVTVEGEVLAKHLKGMVCGLRRSRKLSKGEARGIWDDCIGVEITEEYCRDHYILTVLLGGGWWHDLPTMPNPDYVYLCRIIQAVRDGLRKYIEGAS